MTLIGKIFNALKSRLALNLYFWAWWTYTVFNINYNNARENHYHFHSPWFYIVTCSVLVMVAGMTYFNNLFLLPRYLVRRKYLQYFSIVGITVLAVALVQVSLLRIASPYIEVNHLQQAGATSYYITYSWELKKLLHDTYAYATGHAQWLFVFSMGFFMHDHTRQQKQIAEAERKQIETELHFLKNQVHPHFLFNTLNNLYGLALKKSDSSPDAILRLSSILRYMLYESNVSTVPFEKEKEIMEAYITLELLRLPGGNNLHFAIEADRAYNIPPLLWLTILENSFKHATRVIADNYYIDFHFEIKDNLLTITSVNSFKQGALKNGHEVGGIGLENLSKRLALLYPGKHTILSTDNDNLYKVQVQIELA